ncbi:MAG: lysophospholipid acyltransferase family protein [Bacteroidota bacterium]
MVTTLLKALVFAPATVVFSLAALASLPLDRTGRSYHRVVRNWSRFVLWIFGIRIHAKGLEHLQHGTRYVYVANHASLFDIPAILVGVPDEIRIVWKRELAKVPFWGWALKYGPYISIDRDNAKEAMGSIDRAAESIRNGASVLVFAEGTRTRDGKLQPFKRGAFALAARSGVPILPVAVNNSFQILPKGSWRIRQADIELVLDKPIESTGVMGKEAETKLMEQVHAVLEKNFIEQS